MSAMGRCVVPADLGIGGWQVAVMCKVWVSIAIFCSLACAQEVNSRWQEQVRNFAQAGDWIAALKIVDAEIARAPQDTDVRSWRARVLAWSGSLTQAEREYREILDIAPTDPDHWMGLAGVYSRQGRTKEAVQALERAVELDPKRTDLRIAYARALIAADQGRAAKREFQTAIALDPTNSDARRGLFSLRGEPRHELRIGMGTDLFNFMDSNHDEGISLASQWTSHWRTSIAASSYQRSGVAAQKFAGSLTGKAEQWGALTAGAATAHDNAVIPRAEAFFDYDRGWRLRSRGIVRGLELNYAQHWYWYTTARILTISETSILYLPKEWMWSLGMTGVRSQFSGAGSEWVPAGTAKLAFPIKAWNERRLAGNVVFAVGTENYAQLDQVGRFSSQSYGGGLRFQLTAHQDVSGYATLQRRSQNRTETSFGFSYGIRF